MQQWEYSPHIVHWVLEKSKKDKKVTHSEWRTQGWEAVQKAGLDGWELVSAVPLTSSLNQEGWRRPVMSSYVLFFKRPKPVDA